MENNVISFTNHLQDIAEMKRRKRHATILLMNSKICPFKWASNFFCCFYCDQKFADPSDLRTHNRIDHSAVTTAEVKIALRTMKKYALVKVDITDMDCKICDVKFEEFTELKLHLIEVHKKLIDVKASDGVLPFKVRKGDYKCALCDEKFDDFKSLNQHMNLHFQNFICELCGTGFITPQSLKTHGFSHETGSFPCDICKKVFKSAYAKNEHHASVHIKVKRHRCPQCPETFTNYFQKNKHISSVHGMKLKEWKCSLCPKVFTFSGKLGAHVRAVHLKMKRHACDICEWKFYSRSELKDHMIRHSGERKFQCSVCKKSYARKYTLKEHIRIHQNDRRFVCSICGRSFIQKCSLKHHFKVHHPNVPLDDKLELEPNTKL